MELQVFGVLGIHLAEIGPARLSASPSSVKTDARRRQEVMRSLKKVLLAVLAVATISAGAFAQKGNDNRPPKDNPKVVDKEKQKPPPPNQNNNSNHKKP